MATLTKYFSEYAFIVHITKKPPKNNFLGWYRHFNFLCFRRVNLQLTQIKEWASPDDDNDKILCAKIVEVINHEILHFAIDDAEGRCYLEEEVEPRDNKPEEQIVEALNKELNDKAYRLLDGYDE